MSINENLRKMMEDVGIDVQSVLGNKVEEVIDSLQFMALICDIEDQFEVFIPAAMLSFDEYENVESFISKIEQEIRQQREHE